MVNGIVKGKNFERDVARILSANTKVDWQRVPQSGAAATAQGIKDTKFCGDVFCNTPGADPFTKMTIECKVTGDKIDIHDLLNVNSKLWQWWNQTMKETPLENMEVLVFKYANSKPMIMTSSAYAFKLLTNNEPMVELTTINSKFTVCIGYL